MNGNRMTPLEFFARELRQAREAAGLSQAQLATAIVGYSPSFVAMVETSRRVPKPDFADRCDQVLDTGGILGRLAADLVCKGMPPEWVGRWLTIEAKATSLLWFEPLLVPGLLQIEPYAREVIHHSGRLFDVDDQVEARMARQRVLNSATPPMVVAVLDEGVLRRPIGGPQVMYDQITHLLDLAQRPKVVIQIVPQNAGAYPGLAGPLVVTTFDGIEVVYVDNALSGDVVDRAPDVAALKCLWESLRAEALPAKQSMELMAKVAETWK
ncbi:transcriptional regulator [Sphaerisporangium krabiense]|uniref:Transcriptional regulator with XRE-family HTH domain n=1 Tax=Sphaerisporangium krabiense TaxID=763782 RepID=A0A7W8Z241_9ACTN|nr:helix-turn-helix transcriptional regulator [Sphaerisporangium krabiense]MBB5625753.1 transcriptional regulator with XRE-family HTH domain [Sphaerisporangium krabiense]GII62911.1 transcriptional regulator [Sphaerisporangium krabiense]